MSPISPPSLDFGLPETRSSAVYPPQLSVSANQILRTHYHQPFTCSHFPSRVSSIYSSINYQFYSSRDLRLPSSLDSLAWSMNTVRQANKFSSGELMSNTVMYVYDFQQFLCPFSATAPVWSPRVSPGSTKTILEATSRINSHGLAYSRIGHHSHDDKCHPRAPSNTTLLRRLHDERKHRRQKSRLLVKWHASARGCRRPRLHLEDKKGWRAAETCSRFTCAFQVFLTDDAVFKDSLAGFGTIFLRILFGGEKCFITARIVDFYTRLRSTA